MDYMRLNTENICNSNKDGIVRAIPIIHTLVNYRDLISCPKLIFTRDWIEQIR